MIPRKKSGKLPTSSGAGTPFALLEGNTVLQQDIAKENRKQARNIFRPRIFVEIFARCAVMHRLQAIKPQRLISPGKMDAGQHSKSGHNRNLGDFCLGGGGKGEICTPIILA